MARFNLRKSNIGLILLVLGAFLAGTAAAYVAIDSFSDVPMGYWAYDDISWMEENGITTGYADGTFKPDNNVTRAEMSAFMHRLAGATVAAGLHVTRDDSGTPLDPSDDTIAIDRWFNNVNDQTVTIIGEGGDYTVDWGFDASERFVVCTVDGNYVDTRNATCAAGTQWYSSGSTTTYVRIWDPEGGYQPAEFNLLLY